MQNSLLGVPYDLVYQYGNVPQNESIYNLFNDEPGLTWQPDYGDRSFDLGLILDLGTVKPVGFVCLLGLIENAYPITVSVFEELNGPAVYTGDHRSHFSGGRSVPFMKFFAYTPTKPRGRYVTINFPSDANRAPGFIGLGSPWRLLIGDTIQPEEGIQVGAEEGVDDRSTRRYARSGRRVIDPTVIVPTFQGDWPWLTDPEYLAMRKWWRNFGATRPSLLVLDPEMDSESVHGGEDGIFYGDFEKSSKFSYNDGTYGFSFAMVSIAP